MECEKKYEEEKEEKEEGRGMRKKRTKKQNLPENKCSGGYGEIGILVCY